MITDKTRIIDLNVGQLKKLLSGYELPNQQQETIQKLEEKILKTYFLSPLELGTVEMLTCTEIIDYIESFGVHKITNVKYFGMELRKLFGKPTQKRNRGYLYYCIKKKL